MWLLDCLLPFVSVFPMEASSSTIIKDDFDCTAIGQYAAANFEDGCQEETVFAYDGSARYELIRSGGAAALYDFVNNEFVIENVQIDENADDNGENVVLLLDGEPHLFKTNGETLWPLEKGFAETYADAAYLSTFQATKIVLGQSDEEDAALEAAVKIPNYEYFFHLNGKYGLNDSSVCTMVALQIVLGYYDSFINDGIVPEEWDVPAYSQIENPSSWEDFDDSPGTGSRGTAGRPQDDRMLDHLVDICTDEFDPDIESSGTTMLIEQDVLEYYLNERGLSSSQYSIEIADDGSRPDTEYLNPARTIIKQAIDAGRPVFANGCHHATVAFAYDDDYVYVDTGWGYVGKTEWDAFLCDGSSEYHPNAMDLEIELAHSHSDNYVANDGFYCSCGQKHDSDGLSFSDLNLPNSALGYTKTVTIGSDEDEISVSYNRGYAKNDFLALQTENGSSAWLRIDYEANSVSSFYFKMAFAGYTSYIPDVTIRTKNSNDEWSDYETISLSYSSPSLYAYLRFDFPYCGVEIKVSNSGPTPSIINLTQPVWRNA